MECNVYKLCEVCKSISDGDHLAPPKTASGVPFITISNVIGNSIDFGNTMFVPQDYYDKLDDKRKAKPNDILYTVVGSFGTPVLIKNNIQFAFQRHIAILRSNNNIVPSFLYYTMKSADFYSQADAYAIGSAQRTISLTSLRRMKVALPPLPTQQKIASILSTYDTLIENNTKRIRLLEQMAENLYKEWFVRFRFPGHENVEMENGLPKGWKIERLEMILEIKYGKDHKHIEEGNIPILGSGGVMRYGNKCLYTGESVLIPRKGTLNNIMYRDESFWTVDTMFYTIPKIENVCKYMYYVLSSINMESMNPGAALPSMTTNILNHLKITLPHKDILERFDETIASLYYEIKILQHQISLLTRQRDLLLPRLMSGKLEVKVK